MQQATQVDSALCPLWDSKIGVGCPVDHYCPYFGSSRSFKVIDVDITKKYVSSVLVMTSSMSTLVLHSSYKLGELLHWLHHDDSTINIDILIIIITAGGIALHTLCTENVCTCIICRDAGKSVLCSRI